MLNQITITSPDNTQTWALSVTEYETGTLALTAVDHDKLIPLTTQIPNLVLAPDEICPKQWGNAKPYITQLITQGVLAPTKQVVSVGFATTEIMKLADNYRASLTPVKTVIDLPQPQLAVQYEKVQQAIQQLANLADGGQQAVSIAHNTDFEQEMRNLSEYLVTELENKGEELSHTASTLEVVKAELDAERRNNVDAATVAKVQFAEVSATNSALSTKITELTDDLAQASATITELDAQLSDNEHVMTDLSTKVDELATSLNSATTLIAELENKLNIKEQAISTAMSMFQTAVKTLVGAENSGDIVALLGISPIANMAPESDLSETLALTENKLAETELALNVSKKLNEGLMAEYARIKKEQSFPSFTEYEDIPVLRDITSVQEPQHSRILEEV